MKKLFLIDAYALIFKYYYAFMGRPMRNRAGMNTSIVFGFTKFLRDIQKREHPDLLGVAFDPPGGCFRREIFPEYKANRPATPEDIINSVPYVKRIVKAMCIPILEVPGYEADDVIGTLAFKGAEAGYDVYMVTPDKDYGQLVGQNRKLYKQKGEGIEIVDTEAICTKYGINHERLKKLWLLYQKEGVKVLHRQQYNRSNAIFRHNVVLDIENNGISLVQASIKYGVSTSSLSVWLKTYRTGGIEALSITKKRGRPPGMGRPKKVQKPETELERLQRENRELKIENALLKKVKALVEEREARLRAIGHGQSEN